MIINRYFTGFLISLSFFSCHTQTNKQKINKKQSVQLYVDTSKINIPIQAVSINELKDKLPSNKLSISRTGFIVKV